jgi:hypothetical protein
VPKPNSPWSITRFAGVNDTIPATELEDNQASRMKNLYIVQGGLERRLGTAAVSTSLGPNKPVQGVMYCRLDGNVNGTSDGLSPLDPSVLPYLELYLRSDQITGADGAAVNLITDLSPKGRNTAAVAGATDPTLRKTGANISINGTQTLEWNSALDNLKVVMTPPTPTIPSTNGYTIIAYWKQVGLGSFSGNGQNIFESAVGTSTTELMALSHTNNGYASNGNYGFKYQLNTRATTTTAATTGWHLGILEFTPPASGAGAVTLTVDGTTLSPAPTNWTTVINELLYIGNNSGSNSGLNGALGALVIISNVYSTAVRDALGAYVRNVFEA